MSDDIVSSWIRAEQEKPVWDRSADYDLVTALEFFHAAAGMIITCHDGSHQEDREQTYRRVIGDIGIVIRQLQQILRREEHRDRTP